MSAVQRSTTFAYFLACLCTAAVAAFRLAIGDYAGDQVTLLPFLLSVTIAARYGGLGPGLAAKRIRQRLGGHKITLVAMTGAAGEREIQRCADAGFAACLVKPLTIDDLRHIASNRIERQWPIVLS